MVTAVAGGLPDVHSGKEAIESHRAKQNLRGYGKEDLDGGGEGDFSRNLRNDHEGTARGTMTDAQKKSGRGLMSRKEKTLSLGTYEDKSARSNGHAGSLP